MYSLAQDWVHSRAVEQILNRFNSLLFVQLFYLKMYTFKKVKKRKTLVPNLGVH